MPDYEKHLSHTFYKVADAYREQIKVGQIRKGAEKYPEPLNPDSWTNEELVNHGMEENVDQAYYMFAMRDRMQKQRLTINYLLGILDFVANANEEVFTLETIKKEAIKATNTVRESKGLFIDGKV